MMFNYVLWISFGENYKWQEYYKKQLTERKKLKGVIQAIKTMQETKTYMDDPW